ncbi:MAG: hypothetical protein KDA59_13525, partial [Planctomycetales bacterium]|nr:hypothetical protein [Planctomycetales bacterium]
MNQKPGSGGGNAVLVIVAIFLVLLVLAALACGGLFLFGVRTAQTTMTQAEARMEAMMTEAMAEAERQQALAE